ncbi:MAG: Wzz/FepE/Etk N-terminal domain-containing protein [Bacteroidota bacterium]
MKSVKDEIAKEDEIDLLELIKVVWKSRKFIVKVTTVFAVLGVFVALTSKVEYEASCRLMPESQEGIKGSIGGLSGLAGLAGINLNTGSVGFLPPELYPQLSASTPFQLELIHEPVKFQMLDTTVSSFNYFKSLDSPSFLMMLAGYTIGLPGKVKKMFKKGKPVVSNVSHDFIQLSKEDFELIKAFRERMEVVVDPTTGIISVSSQMPDPYAAAQVTDLLVRRLTDRVIQYKLEKVKLNLEFINDRYLEAEEEYELKQKQLARFTDGNRNITSSLKQIEFQRLNNDLSIAFEVYKGLASQLEQAKIKVKEQTPVFTVLEPIRVPEDKSKPQRGLIVVVFVLVGAISSSGYSIISNNR